MGLAPANRTSGLKNDSMSVELEKKMVCAILFISLLF